MSNDVSITLGKKLRELRERAGLSLREVAKAAKAHEDRLESSDIAVLVPFSNEVASYKENAVYPCVFPFPDVGFNSAGEATMFSLEKLYSVPGR